MPLPTTATDTGRGHCTPIWDHIVGTARLGEMDQAFKMTAHSLHTLFSSLVEASRHSVVSASPHTTNPSSQDWEQCCASDLEGEPSLNHVFIRYTCKASLYSSSSPKGRTQRNTTVGKHLILSCHHKTPDKEPAIKHTFSEKLQWSSSWMNKNVRLHRGLKVEMFTPELSSATQTQECSDSPQTTVEGGDGHLLSSYTHAYPRSSAFLCSDFSVHVNRGKLVSFRFSVSWRKGINMVV